MASVLSCAGIRKTFTYHVRHSLLQDAVLRRRMPSARREICVLKDAALNVEAGEWVGLYGPNGAGKTTLLRILGGLLPPDAGHVAQQGNLSLFLGLGVGFDTELAAERNIYHHGLLHGLRPAEIRARTEEIIAFAGLDQHWDLPLKHYSSGMRLRLAFAAAAHVDADMYLFDEVLAVGDAAFRDLCSRHLQALKKRGAAAILVSHSLSDLRRWCDRILTLQDGRLQPFMDPGVAAGTPYTANSAWSTPVGVPL
jgi:ABC-type polysaccharide/polyol phosphate transport system ATPase subunit